MGFTKLKPGPEDDPVEFYLREYAWDLRAPEPDKNQFQTQGRDDWTDDDETKESKQDELRDTYRYAQQPIASLKTLAASDRQQRAACAASMWESGMRWQAISDVVRVPVDEIRKAGREVILKQREAMREARRP